jgi:hypothetical protein
MRLAVERDENGVGGKLVVRDARDCASLARNGFPQQTPRGNEAKRDQGHEQDRKRKRHRPNCAERRERQRAKDRFKEKDEGDALPEGGACLRALVGVT